jgi:hypothetical protein
MKRLILLAVLLCASAASFAHRFHAGMTDIAFNDKTGSVEVVHTYMAHDIDAVLAELHGRPVDLGQSAGEALLRQYIERHFYLLGADKRRIALKWVGITVSVDSVVIYQEAERTALPALAAMHNEVLVGFLPRQANTVNVRQDGQIRSLTFDRKYPERTLK